MCDSPLLAWRPGTKNPKTGKDIVRFLPRRYDMSFEQAKSKYGDSLLLIPCGRCPSCTRLYAQEWSIRLMAESLYHEKMCFLTLTYDDRHLPDSMDGVKRDLQKFFKRLRKHFDQKIRYFACGEYGDIGHRRHAHCILFGVDFEDDKEWISDNNLRNHLYKSETLSSIWKNGNCSIGTVTFESCKYVARYSLKKRMTLEKSDEFVLMSRKPPLGYQYFEDHKHEIYLSDRIYLKGTQPVPKIFDRLIEKSDDIVLDYFYTLQKEMRLKRANANADLYLGAYNLPAKEVELSKRWSEGLERMKKLKRSL